ncbi:acyltransferase family protein [Metabacillus arenae]|uniref:Acyltransferase family protein n=1 Tax=Metabacillus arenae TaxID=2771434 RepID=A0A926NC65_9BACI|nr:acyltransferase family protein [Metabacillus arenae]MBD1378849.1 acyltransferase family protein [Metabacillus arenae]
MQINNNLNEIFWLRAFACVAVVIGHTIQLTNVEFNHIEPANIYSIFLNYLLLASLFGTPIFVFISEMLLSKKYPKKLPSKFIRKRIKYIFLPFVFMNIVYAILHLENFSIQSLVIESLKNILLGHSILYFVLIVFQFYFLHLAFNKYLNKLSPLFILPLTFVINVVYLGIFNFMDPPNTSLFFKEIWRYGYWLPFLGWIFYFSLGFYCGKFYDVFLSFLLRLKYVFIFLPLVTYSLCVVVNKYAIFKYTTSKRIDMIFYTISIIFFIILISKLIPKTPRIIFLLSNYSFCIYLLHMVFIHLLELALPFSYLNKFTYLLFASIITISCSIIFAYIVNKLKFGKFLVGNINNFNTSRLVPYGQKKTA